MTNRGILYEILGAIRIILDGQIRREWDLATKMKELKFCDSFGKYPRDQRPKVFKKNGK